MKKSSKIFMAVSGVFLFVLLILTINSNSGYSGDDLSQKLIQLNSDKANLEIQLTTTLASKIQAQKALDEIISKEIQLKDNIVSLQNQINAIINGNPLPEPEKVPEDFESVSMLPVAYADSQYEGQWEKNDDLQTSLDKLWVDSENVRDLSDELIGWCKGSSVPRVCTKVIAAQMWFETHNGTKGTGKSYKNLTGITCRKAGSDEFMGVKYSYGCTGRWRIYSRYKDSLMDTTRLFIEGKYQDAYTKYGWDSGLARHLKTWGTNQISSIKTFIYENLD